MNFEKKEMIDLQCGFSCDMRTVKKFPLHGHDYYEMEITVEGESMATVNGHSVPLRKGTLCCMAPGDIHAITGEGEMVTLNLSFDGRLWDPLANIKLPFICELGEESLFLAKELFTLLEGVTDGFLRRTLAEALLTLCTRDAAQYSFEDPVGKAKAYLVRHFRENPSLKLCAQRVGLSPNYLALCFKKKYGLSFKECLTGYKLRCAKTFLENGASVTQACFDSGFESLSAFYTAFKKENGVAPSRWKG